MNIKEIRGRRIELNPENKRIIIYLDIDEAIFFYDEHKEDYLVTTPVPHTEKQTYLINGFVVEIIVRREP